MSFTYDPLTDLGRVRQLVADTRKASHGFTDEEIAAMLGREQTRCGTEGGIWSTAAQCLDLLIVDKARRARVFSQEGVSVDETTTIEDLKDQRDSYLARAAEAKAADTTIEDTTLGRATMTPGSNPPWVRGCGDC